MTDLHVPKGVSRETLLDIVAGWDDAGAAEEPVRTATVAEGLGLADSVSRQTRFLESLGVLEADGQQHRLTDAGAELGAARADGDTAATVEALRSLLSRWSLSDRLERALGSESLSEAAVVAELADAVDESPEGRVRTGLTTLLDCYVWTGLVERVDGRYRLPDAAEAAGEEEGERNTLSVGLELSVDLDPEDVEGLVAALRRGLATELEDREAAAAPSIAADVDLDDDAGIHLEAEPVEDAAEE